MDRYDRYQSGIPKSQNAAQTRGSAPSKAAFSRDLYMAQEDDGLPGRGSISVLDQSLLGNSLTESTTKSPNTRVYRQRATRGLYGGQAQKWHVLHAGRQDGNTVDLGDHFTQEESG